MTEEFNGIRKPTQAIHVKSISDCNKTSTKSYPFINPNINPLVRIFRPVGNTNRKQVGSFIFRPVPVQDPESYGDDPVPASFLSNDADIDIGYPKVGNWLTRISAVLDFGFTAPFTSFVLSDPNSGYTNPRKNNPYSIIYSFLQGKRANIPYDKQDWKELVATDPSNGRYYSLMSAPSDYLVIPAFIYRDNSAAAVEEYDPDILPFGAKDNDPLPLVFIKGMQAFGNLTREIFRQGENGLAYGDPIQPSSRYLFYVTCGGTDPVSGTALQSTSGYTFSLSKNYRKSNGKAIDVDASITNAQMQTILNKKSFPWWEGTDYDGIFRCQSDEEILFLMASSFPHIYRVAEFVLGDQNPDLFSDRVMKAFDACPKKERDDTLYIDLINNKRAFDDAKRAESARNENSSSVGYMSQRQYNPTRSYSPNNQQYYQQQPSQSYNSQRQQQDQSVYQEQDMLAQPTEPRQQHNSYAPTQNMVINRNVQKPIMPNVDFSELAANVEDNNGESNMPQYRVTDWSAIE